jgi:putative membrane protein
MNTIFSQIYYYRPPHGFGWSLIMFVVWVVIIGILIYLILHFISYHHYDLLPDHHKDPLEIAKTRYAKGGIDKAEFEEIKKELQS